MARDRLPTAAERRKLLSVASPELSATGRRYLEQGRWGEALECLETAGDREGLEQVRQAALEAGDYFFWRRALTLLGQSQDPAELTRLAHQALAAGKAVFQGQATAQVESGRSES